MVMFRNFALWVIIALLLLALFTLFQNPGERPAAQEISYSQFFTEVDNGRVRDVVIQGPEIHGAFADGRRFQTYAPNDPTLVQRLFAKGVTVSARSQQNDVPWFVSLIIAWLPFLAWIALLIYFVRAIRHAFNAVGEVAVLKHQIDELKQEIERLKGSQKPAG